jgi:hypothetical protein
MGNETAEKEVGKTFAVGYNTVSQKRKRPPSKKEKDQIPRELINRLEK